MVLDNPDELLFMQEARLRFLQNSKNELKADDLSPDHIVANLLVSLGFFLPLD